MLNSDLRRSENMTGRMERDPYAIEIDDGAVVSRLDGRLTSKSVAQQRLSGGAAQICARLGTKVIAVRMRDHGPIDGLPGIDMELARLAIQAPLGGLN